MKLHSHVTGSGQPVVLLHGLLASGHYWNEVIESLDTTKYKVITIDLLGFGQSPKPKTGYSIENYAKLILETINESAFKAPVILVGHSMGSLVAAYLAHTHPELIKSLVLVSPPFYESKKQAQQCIESESTYAKVFRMEPIARASCWVMCHAYTPLRKILPLINRGVPKLIAQDTLRHNWHSYSGALNSIILNQNYLTHLQKKVPMTILYGSKDKLMVPKNILNFSDKAIVKKIETGHHIPLDHASAVIEAIKAN